jgi:hypothetical protein
MTSYVAPELSYHVRRNERLARDCSDLEKVAAPMYAASGLTLASIFTVEAIDSTQRLIAKVQEPGYKSKSFLPRWYNDNVPNVSAASLGFLAATLPFVVFRKFRNVYRSRAEQARTETPRYLRAA